MTKMTMRKLYGSGTILGGQIRATVTQKFYGSKPGEVKEVTELWLGHIYELSTHEKEGGPRILDLSVVWFAHKAIATADWQMDLEEDEIVRCPLDAEVRDLDNGGLWEVKVESTRLQYEPKATLILVSSHKVAYYPLLHKG